MSGFLFEQIIFGPIRSRRLGISLGINLLPTYKKHCTYNCIYCECGLTPPPDPEVRFPKRDEVKKALEQKLASMKDKDALLDSITYAGNGEPTIHPHFEGIVNDTIELRNKYYPDTVISVLTNASKVAAPGVADALLRIEQPILKLDAGTNQMFQKLNNPRINITLEQIIENMMLLKGKAIIQTLFIRGSSGDTYVDNTTEEEVSAWLVHLEKLQPRLVMIYPIARETPVETLEKIDSSELMEIARRVEELGFETEVF